MLRVIYSNDLHQLAQAFANSLKQSRSSNPDWLFQPLLVAVPNRTVGAFIEFALAEQLGAVGHLQVKSITELIAETTQKSAGVKIAHRDSLTAALHNLFLDKHKLSVVALKPVRAYLTTDGPEVGLERRRLQLAEHVAGLFLRYASEAPERVEGWLNGEKSRSKKHLSEEEIWQRELYRQLFSGENLSVAALWPSVQKLSAQSLPQNLALFGHAYFSPLERRLIGLLQQESTVEVYAFNACRQFWDDLDFSPPSSEEDCAPLRRFGTRNLTTVRFLNELANYDTIDRWTEPKATGKALTMLRLAVLDRQPVTTQGHDSSIEFWQSPNPRRELESAAAQIWQNMAADSTLGFNDIAIFVPRSKLAEYASLAPLVFSEVGQLPFQRTIGPSSQELTVLAASKKLLRLPLTLLTREAVLDFLSEPVVARQLTASQPADWQRWCDTLGIWHGVDESAHDGTYLENVETESGFPSFHWDQGITRLALGRWMASDYYHVQSAPMEVTLEGKHYRPFSLAEEQIPAAMEFGALLRDLVTDLKALISERHPMQKWGERIGVLLEKYLRPESVSERQTYLDVRAELNKFQELPWSEQPVPYLAAGEWMIEKIGQFFERSSSYIGPGVPLLPLTDSMALPFREVFLLGLDEKCFPAFERSEALDLLAQDVGRSPVGSLDFSDRQALIERLVTTQDRLVLSYVEREVRGGDPLEPSPLVKELHGWLGESGWRRISVNGFDDDALLRFSDTTRNLRRAEALRGDAAFNVTEALGSLSTDQRALLAGELAVTIASADPIVETNASGVEQSIPLRGLRRFLECPLQAYAEFVLGMRRESEREVELDWEPFAMHGYHQYALLDATIEETLRISGTQAPFSQFMENYRLFERVARHGGQLPHGIFGAAEVARHIAWLKVWAEKLATTGENQRLLRYSIGRPAHELRATRHLPALRLSQPENMEASGQFLSLRGTTDLVNEDGSLAILFRQRFPAKEKLIAAYKIGLRAFLHHVILSSAGVVTGEQSLSVISADETPVVEFSLAAIEPNRARHYLTLLAHQFTHAPHDYLLPCEAVISAWLENDHESDFHGWIEKLAGDSNRTISSDFGPLTGARTKTIPSPEQLRQIVTDRYGLFFELIEFDSGLLAKLK